MRLRREATIAGAVVDSVLVLQNNLLQRTNQSGASAKRRNKKRRKFVSVFWHLWGKKGSINKLEYFYLLSIFLSCTSVGGCS
jgi:hypothetical protein